MPGQGPWSWARQFRLGLAPQPSAAPGSAGPQVVNQWAASFAQPAAFQTTPPALQSVVVALTPANSVMTGGTGVSTAWNWLFCLVGGSETYATSGFTVGDSDDIHSWWRPGPVSTGSALTRTSIWYTPNIARQVNQVYVAPNGAFSAITVLVVEVAGLGPWDVVTGVYSTYQAAATSLNLTLAAPAAQAFLIGAVAGDLSTAGQSFAPAGWSALHTVTATNGTDHTTDSVLTSACVTTSGGVSVNAAAGSAADLSGAVIGVLTSAPSPIPAGWNASWPYTLFEAALGGGFQTPQDQLTWTQLPNRLWAWDETTGVPYMLGQLQSSQVALQVDNRDGNFSPWNSASPWPVTTGTPVRVRFALGPPWNRWYVWSRNALQWPEQRNQALVNYSPAKASDVWSVASAACPSPYRGEVRQDTSLYAWWAMDDQPLSGGVQPMSLRNSAAGNPNTLTVNPAPGGVSAEDAYSTTGTDLTTFGGTAAGTQPPTVATGEAAHNPGWMYGDPQSSAAAYQSGNPVTASPGAASWQQSGEQGNTGSRGWFLTCNDVNFPVLAGGISFGLWFNATFQGTTGYVFNNPTLYVVAGQPAAVITLATLMTASAPVAKIQLDSSGHLILITFNGATGTSHTIYSASDLRTSSWHHVMLTATTSTWAVYLDGGINARVAGSGAGMTSAWTWLAINADFGAGGGSSLSSNVNSGNVAYAHAEVYSAVLPAWRVLGRYCGAVTGFGLLPAPQSVQITLAETQLNTIASTYQQGAAFTPDGTENWGSYGITGSPGTGTVSTSVFSAVAVAQAGSFNSGPSARAVAAIVGQGAATQAYGAAVFVSFAGVAPSFGIYTAAAPAAEKNASTTSGNSDTYTSGYGSGASGHGSGETAAGTNAAYPASASQLGDTAGQRIERILGYSGITYPGRSVDTTPNAVQAALDIGGQQAGGNVQNIVSSDNGLLSVDNNGALCYRAKAHLAADTPVWQIGMNTAAGQIPFQGDIGWDTDPQRIWNDIRVIPYSPDGATLPVITPSNAAAVNTSQLQYGDRPYPVTSYLQSSAGQQAQANWLFTTNGAPARRIANLTVNAAGHPAAWVFVVGANVGDICQVFDAPLGQPATTGTYRITQIKRTLSRGANQTGVKGTISITADPVPASYWS